MKKLYRIFYALFTIGLGFTSWGSWVVGDLGTEIFFGILFLAGLIILYGEDKQ